MSKNEPIYQHTENNKWPDRDSLPTEDPIGDTYIPPKNLKIRYIIKTKDTGPNDHYAKGTILAVLPSSDFPDGWEDYDKYVGENDNEWTKGYKTWKKDMDEYIKAVRPSEIEGTGLIKEPPKCDCGTWKTYGKDTPISTHSTWCKLRN